MPRVYRCNLQFVYYNCVLIVVLTCNYSNVRVTSLYFLICFLDSFLEKLIRHLLPKELGGLHICQINEMLIPLLCGVSMCHPALEQQHTSALLLFKPADNGNYVEANCSV